MKAPITRREFMRTSLAGTGLTLAVFIIGSGYKISKAGEVKSDPLNPFSPSVWIQITSDNIVTVVVNKSNMGQGVYTSLPMIAADELDADWNQIKFTPAPAGEKYIDPVWGMELTGGSTSVRHMFEPLRKAGATAREMLVTAAAQTWGVPRDQCVAHKGAVREKTSGRTLTYGQLVEKASTLPIPENPPLKKESQYTLIGQPLARLDIPSKVHASAVFGIDASVPGMVYADIARAPAYGAHVVSYDKEAAEALPGVHKVVPISTGIAVTADSITAAWQGKKALKVRWSKGSNPDLNDETLERRLVELLEKPGKPAKQEGNVKNALSSAAKKISATYVLPYLAHMCMEPMNCMADVREDQCDIWAPTQNQTGSLDSAMKITGLKPDRINIHTTYLGGGFGRRGEIDYVDEVVQISKATGKPVKLIWAREDDVKHDFYRPGNSCKIEGGMDERGKLIAWSHKVVCQPIGMARMENGIAPNAVDGILNQYEIPNTEILYVYFDEPINTGYWRSVGNSQNAFTVESFMDELSYAAKKDPLEFRLALLEKNANAREVLQVVAEKSGWGKSPKEGEALGMAYHYCFGTHVAEVAEVSVNEKSGEIKVHRVVGAVDCGLNVNPAIIAAQIRGAITMGLSAALKEEVKFAKGGVQSANFYNYPILKMKEVPKTEVHIVKGKAELGGIGEPGLPPVAPAVANAVFRATGVRIRKLPMTPERLKSETALKGQTKFS
jgi:isoquinoline 1-oxidoreductase beta subunit